MAVPSDPLIKWLMHKNTRNMKNFGMQSTSQAPVVADPPPKVSDVGFTHEQFVKILVSFSKLISSEQPAWQAEM